MISFIALAQLVNDPINPELTNVMSIDIVGLVILILGYIVYRPK